jgi:hypothetical protein
MAKDKERAVSPPQFADTPPPTYSAPQDYSYVETIMAIQATLGRLNEAVESLKEQVKTHGSELRIVSNDIHTAKTTVKIVGVILAALIAFAGWAINKGVDAWVASHPATAQVQQK